MFNAQEAKELLQSLDSPKNMTLIHVGASPEVNTYHVCQVCGTKSLFVHKAPDGRLLCPTHKSQGVAAPPPTSQLTIKAQKERGRKKRIKIISEINQKLVMSFRRVDKEKIKELRKEHLLLSAKHVATKRHQQLVLPPPLPIKKPGAPFSERNWKKCKECQQTSSKVFYHSDWKIPICPKCAHKIKARIKALFLGKNPRPHYLRK